MKTFLNFTESWKKILIISTITFVCSITCFSQVLSDTTLLKALFIPEAVKNGNSLYLRKSESEMKVLLSFYFLLYKEFISSQDVDACVFYPSCSNYTIDAVEKKGIIVGFLEGLDRLSRCHPYKAREDYPYNKFTMKYYDPFY